MSNLGGYQAIVMLMKRCGGPKVFWVVIPALSYGLGKLIEIPIRAIARHLRAKKNFDQSEAVLEVTSAGIDGTDFAFQEGDSYQVLYSDTEMVMIETIGDTNSLCMVSPEFLRTVSNYG